MDIFRCTTRLRVPGFQNRLRVIAPAVGKPSLVVPMGND